MATKRRRLILASGLVALAIVAGVAMLLHRQPTKDHLTLTGAGGEASTTSSSTPASTEPNTSSTAGSSTSTTTPKTTSTSKAPDSTSSSSTTVPGPLTITASDSGKTFVVHRGQHVDVDLSSSLYTSTEPASSDEMRVHRTGGNSGDNAKGSFMAESDGAADITSTQTPKCYPACKLKSNLFQVHITVTG
jgi:cytoskeletal protein RodZ